jgi:DNA adenine methylase
LRNVLTQFTSMAEILGGIDGAFILSINDRPEIREVFGSFHMDEVELTYSVSRGKSTEAKELIVSNRQVRMGLI